MALELEVRGDTRGFVRQMGLGRTASIALGSAIGILTTKALAGLGRAFGELTDRSGQLNSVSTGFENLSAAAGLSADVLLREMRPATLGLVSDFDLMKQANNAMTLGIVRSEEEFGELVKGATVLGRTLGIDTTHALESLTIGLGRQSKLVLDNLGIIVDTEKAYADYAEQLGITVSEMSDAEKKTAFLNAAMKGIKETSEAAGGAQLVLADRLMQASVWFRNLVDRILTVINTSGPLNAALDAVFKEIRKLTGGTEGIVKAFGQAIPGAVKFTLDSFVVLVKAGETLRMAWLATTTGLSAAWNLFSVAFFEATATVIRGYNMMITAQRHFGEETEGEKLALDILQSTLEGYANTLEGKANTAVDKIREGSEALRAEWEASTDRVTKLEAAVDRVKVAMDSASGAAGGFAGNMRTLKDQFTQVIPFAEKTAHLFGTISLGGVDAEFDTSLPGKAPGKGGLLGMLGGLFGGGGRTYSAACWAGLPAAAASARSSQAFSGADSLASSAPSVASWGPALPRSAG
jgi:ABC-type transporter Mla subunit MlaD